MIVSISYHVLLIEAYVLQFTHTRRFLAALLCSSVRMRTSGRQACSVLYTCLQSVHPYWWKGHPGFKTHGEGHIQSKIGIISGPQKWSNVNDNQDWGCLCLWMHKIQPADSICTTRKPCLAYCTYENCLTRHRFLSLLTIQKQTATHAMCCHHRKQLSHYNCTASAELSVVLNNQKTLYLLFMLCSCLCIIFIGRSNGCVVLQ